MIYKETGEGISFYGQRDYWMIHSTKQNRNNFKNSHHNEQISTPTPFRNKLLGNQQKQNPQMTDISEIIFSLTTPKIATNNHPHFTPTIIMHTQKVLKQI